MTNLFRKQKKKLGLIELIAIALGGMVGGGIFSILGVSVSLIGFLTPIAIIIGGIIASFAAYSYVKLGLYYKDEGATYSFYKKTFNKTHFSAAAIGWFIIFGYISTLGLYAYTFSSYAISGTSYADNEIIRKIVSVGVIILFAIINAWSVNGMGKIEDIMVYTKLLVLFIISIILMENGTTNFEVFMNNMAKDIEHANFLTVLIVASLTFVSYEGFQLVIHAYNEMKNPQKNIPRAIYSAIILAIIIYVVISLGALFAIPTEQIIKDKEYALAAGAGSIIGKIGTSLVILGAILATSSAISGTVFGSSRLMAVIATDGYFPKYLQKKINYIPVNAIITMAICASLIILVGRLELILEFGSITFLLVSFLMAYANFTIKDKTNSSVFITIISLIGLFIGGILILYYEFSHKWEQMTSIVLLYIILAILAWLYAKKREKEDSIIKKSGI